MKYLKFIFLVIFILILSAFLYLFFDKQGTCVSDGKVWDSSENRCRDDCLSWNEEQGCIPL